MDKKGHIEYWITIAESDWVAIQGLLTTKSYVHALFFAHLTLEKLLKAHWTKDNLENHPPRTHNLVKILNETKLNLTENQTKFLEELNDFQLEGRYPDYQLILYKKCDLEYTNAILTIVNEIRLCLIANL